MSAPEEEYDVTSPRNDRPWAAAPPDRRSLQEEMAIQIERGRPDGAAFLDGLSDEDLADFAMAAQVQAELEAQEGVAVPVADDAADAPDPPSVAAGVDDAATSDPGAGDPPLSAEEPGVIPLRRPERAPRRLDPRWVAVAAVLAGVMLVPFALRTVRGGAVTAPSQAVAMLENPAAGVPKGYEDNHPWDRTRGGGGPGTEERLAVRLGAYMVDLELAVRARDAEQTRLLVGRINARAQDVNTGGLITNALQPVLRQAGGEPSAVLPELENASETATILLDPDWLALGAWAEAARFAAVRQDAEYFRNARTRRTLDRAEALVGDHEGARDAVAGIRAAFEADPPNWTALKTAVDALLRAVA